MHTLDGRCNSLIRVRHNGNFIPIALDYESNLKRCLVFFPAYIRPLQQGSFVLKHQYLLGMRSECTKRHRFNSIYDWLVEDAGVGLSCERAQDASKRQHNKVKIPLTLKHIPGVRCCCGKCLREPLHHSMGLVMACGGLGSNLAAYGVNTSCLQFPKQRVWSCKNVVFSRGNGATPPC